MIIFDDVIFPNAIIKMACTGKRKRFTDLSTTASGFSNTNIRWSRTLREFDVGSVARPVPQWEQIASLHEVLEGRAYGCLFRDPTDSLVGIGEGVLRPIDSNRIGLANAGTGFGVATYRLAKRYALASRFKDVDVAKPELATVILYKNGAPINANAGAYTLDATTGIVTFGANAPYPQVSDTLTWTGSYFVPVAFASDELDWSMLAGGRENARIVSGPSIVLSEQRVG